MDARAAEIWASANSMTAKVDSAKAEILQPGFLPPGMRHLILLMRFHNAVMGGGLSFAVEISGQDLLSAALEAMTYFGLSDVRRLLEGIDGDDPDYDLLPELNDNYYVVTREDQIGVSAVAEAFENMFQPRPEDFGA